MKLVSDSHHLRLSHVLNDFPFRISERRTTRFHFGQIDFSRFLPLCRHIDHTGLHRCRSLARLSLRLQLYQIVHYTDQVYAAGIHELSSEEHQWMEHRKRSPRLHRWVAFDPSDADQCIQLW